MSNKIDQEIEEISEEMEKSTTSAQERLFNTIRELGPEGLKARVATLEKSEKELLFNTLEEMKKGKKAVEMDKEYAAEYVKGNVNDTVLQEDKADDDQDEKLVKPEAAKQKHQGDETPEGKEGQVIKSELEETLDAVKKSEDMLKSMVSRMRELGKTDAEIIEKCVARGIDENELAKAMEAKDNPEADQVEDKLDDLQKEKARGDKKRPEELKLEEDNKEAQKKVDAPIKKAEWAGENDLLKSGRGQQNHHFSVNDYYSDILSKLETEESLAKSDLEDDLERDEDLNDIIAKGEDQSYEQVLAKSMAEENKKKVNGKIVKSFSDNEIAQALGLSDEEAAELLGE